MFILFVCLSHRGRLIGVKLVKMPKHKLVRHFSTDRALYSDKARSFSQSERALYRNFIINHNRSFTYLPSTTKMEGLSKKKKKKKNITNTRLDIHFSRQLFCFSKESGEQGGLATSHLTNNSNKRTTGNIDIDAT